jgi:hypothetical protein
VALLVDGTCGPNKGTSVAALVVLWRLRYKLSLRDLAEMFLIRGMVFSYARRRVSESRPQERAAFAAQTASFSSLAGRKATFLLAAICMVSPVAGPRLVLPDLQRPET